MTPGQEFTPKVRATVNGVAQKPIEGVSMAYSFDDAEAAERHKTQYFEMLQSPSGKPTSGLPVNRPQS